MADPAFADMTLVTSFVEVEEIFKSKDFAPGWGQGTNAPFRAHTLTALEGREHFERRRLEAVLFRKEALADYDGRVLLPAIRRGLEACRASPGADGVVRADLQALVRPMYLAVSAAIAGIDGLDRLAAATEFYGDAELITEGSHVHWSPREGTRVMREALAAKRRFVECYFKPSWSRRLALVAAEDGDPGAHPDDLLTLIIRDRHYFEEWDDDLAVREAMMYLTGGLFSPTNALPHIVVELAAWIERRPANIAKLRDMGFLRDAVCEGLRLHPPGPPKHRVTQRDTVLSTGRAMRAGEHILLDFVAANRDGQVFGAEADSFRIPRRRAVGAQPYGLTFGGGAHTCIGQGFAVGEAGAAAPGLMVRILHELYQAGMRPDPDLPAQRKPDNPQGNYAVFPIRLDSP